MTLSRESQVCCAQLRIIGGHRHRPLCLRYPTSDIDISYSDIGTKYVGLNPLIPMSEVFRYWHQLPFRYRTESILNIPISKIDKSFPIDPRKILSIINSSHRIWTHNFYVRRHTTVLRGFTNIDVGYRISDKSIFRYPKWSQTLSTSVRYRTFRFQAQPDIADHRYRTECPPMIRIYYISIIQASGCLFTIYFPSADPSVQQHKFFRYFCMWAKTTL